MKVKKSRRTAETSQDGSGDLNRPLPDAAAWEPRDAAKPLATAFGAECNQAEERLLQGLRHERDLAVDSFDSGLPFEGLVRRELQRLLPRRYSITPGLVLDRDGKTAGNCDIVIYNDIWFSMVKASISEGVGHPYLPVESVYAVGEVKQTLSSASLDLAMEKLVKCQRLNRPRTFAHRVVENREGTECPHGLTNPLFSFVLSGGVSQNESFLDLVNRFFDISKQLKRLEVVRVLCVLGEGSVGWAFHDPLRNGEVCPALFVKDDLFYPILPILSPAAFRGPLLFLMQMLQLSLFHVVLGAEDLATVYSLDSCGIRIPNEREIELPPDPEWAALLHKPCGRDHS